MFAYIKREIARVVNRAYLSVEGLVITWKTEKSFQQWVILNIISIAFAFYIDMTHAERALIIGFGMLVLVAELINTAVEAAIDRISEDIHPLSKKAKDVACAAVAVTALTTCIIWCIILFPKWV